MNSEIAELKNQIIETNKDLKTELDEVNAKEFEYLYEKCEPFEDDKAAHKYCKKTVKDNIRELVGEAKALVKGIRSDIKEIRNKIKNRSLFKKEAMEKYRIISIITLLTTNTIRALYLPRSRINAGLK